MVPHDMTQRDITPQDMVPFGMVPPNMVLCGSVPRTLKSINRDTVTAVLRDTLPRDMALPTWYLEIR